MNSELPEDRDVKELWLGQLVEGVQMSVDQVRVSAGKFQRTIQWRNAREYIAALAVAVLCGYQLYHAGDPLVRGGFGLLIAGLAYMTWRLHKSGAARALPQDAGLWTWIEFERRELERQRDLLQSVWRWYLGPMIPGVAVLTIAFVLAKPGSLKFGLACAALYVAVFLGIAKLNSAAARKLQRRIDELDGLSGR